MSLKGLVMCLKSETTKHIKHTCRHDLGCFKKLKKIYEIAWFVAKNIMITPRDKGILIFVKDGVTILNSQDATWDLRDIHGCPILV